MQKIRRIVTREGLIRAAKQYKPTEEFIQWLKRFLKEDGEILDELAKR